MINLCKRNKRSRRVGWMEEEKKIILKLKHTYTLRTERHITNEGIHGHQRRYSARENKDGNKQDLHAFYMHTLCVSIHTHRIYFFHSFLFGSVWFGLVLFHSVFQKKNCTLMLGCMLNSAHTNWPKPCAHSLAIRSPNKTETLFKTV